MQVRRLVVAVTFGSVALSGSWWATAEADSIESPDTTGDVGSDSSLVLDAAGNPVVSYYDSDNGDLKILRCSNSDCSGTQTPQAPDTAGVVGLKSSLVLDAAGNPVVSYYDLDNGDLKVLHCSNYYCSGTQTPQAPDTAGVVGLESSLKLDAVGNPVIAYYDLDNGDLKVLHCTNPDCSGTQTPEAPDTIGDVGLHPSMALDAAGNPVIAYYDLDNGDLKVLRCTDPTCSGTQTAQSPDTIGDLGLFPSMVLDAVGNPVISYFDNSNDDLKVLHCTNPDCSGAQVPQAPDTSGNVGFFPSIALDGAGNPVISYWDDSTEDLLVLHCTNSDCSGDQTAQSPDSAGLVGLSPSIALDAAGNPVVSYYDGNSGNLNVLHCNDPSCVPPVDAGSPDMGEMTSIVLDANGNPVVAYRDDATDHLRVMHCTNPRCIGPQTGWTVDTTGNAGIYPSIRLDSTGNPVIAYYRGDSPDRALILLRCNDPACIPGGDIRTVVAPVAITNSPSLQLGAEDEPVIAYSDGTGLYLMRCNDPFCIGGDENIRLMDGDDDAKWPSLQLDSLDRPMISHYRGGTSMDLRTAWCDDAACVSVGSEGVDSTGDVGLMSSLALDENENPVISYVDTTNSAIKLAHCGTRTCFTLSRSITTPEPDSAWWPNLALDDLGNPVIAYAHLLPGHDLRLLRCDDPNCAGIENPIAVSATGDVGQTPSMVLDQNNNAVIAHHNITDGVLEVYRQMDQMPNPLRYVALEEPCSVYSSSTDGPLAANATRTIQVTGPLPSSSGNGGEACISAHVSARAIVYSVRATSPEGPGNLRLSAAGVVANGGIVNYTSNNLQNTNTVTVPIGVQGRADLFANNSGTGVSVTVIGYHAAQGTLEYVPVTPCAVADSRPAQGAGGDYVGPISNNPLSGTPDIDVVGTFPIAQGGGNTNCGVPAGAEAILVNVVSIGGDVGPGVIQVSPGGTLSPLDVTTFSDIGLNNAASAIVPLNGGETLRLRVGAFNTQAVSTHIRVVVLGYLDDSSGSVYTPVNPCAAFDTRDELGASGSFLGPRSSGPTGTTTYQLTGVIPAAQGGSGGDCGVPTNATAALINLVSIQPTQAGNFRAYATGTTPTGGILNFTPLSPLMNNSNAVVVPLSAAGQVDLFANTGSNDGTATTHTRGVILGYYN